MNILEFLMLLIIPALVLGIPMCNRQQAQIRGAEEQQTGNALDRT